MRHQIEMVNGSIIRFGSDDPGERLISAVNRHPMPGRRLLIARYLKQLRKCRDKWRKQATQGCTRPKGLCPACESAAAKADGFQEGLWIILQYLPLLVPADVSAWVVQYRINEMVSMMARSTDPQIIPFVTGLESCSYWLEPVARRLSGKGRLLKQPPQNLRA